MWEIAHSEAFITKTVIENARMNDQNLRQPTTACREKFMEPESIT